MSKPFELPPHDLKAKSGEWIETFLYGEAVLKGHVDALSQPGANPEILKDLVKDLLNVQLVIFNFNQVLSNHEAEIFDKDVKDPIPDLNDPGKRPTVSEIRVLIKNPVTARNRASAIECEALKLLFRVRAGKHPILGADNVTEELRTKVDGLLDNIDNVEMYRPYFDPGDVGTKRWAT